ncbi:hypothetical protein [Curtobacterium sp. MCJR17_043]|uniref:hypothetical protein n=1 Tax=Curtobacterium sp. MCJR17_043 TaxID=2175660 RepID=UPI0032E87C53
MSDSAPDTTPVRDVGVRDVEVRAMRRALELAARGPAVGDHARVGAVLLSPRG